MRYFSRFSFSNFKYFSKMSSVNFAAVRVGLIFMFLLFHVVMKTVTTSDEVRAGLTRLKADLRARSLDEVLRKLLEAWKQLKQ